jgi:uncharacterized protein YoxC
VLYSDVRTPLMTKKQELREEIETFWKIYITARHSLEITKYLADSKTKRSENLFWKHIQITCFKNAIVELDKLVSESENQKFRVSKLISKLLPKGHFRTFQFPEEKINEWNDQLHEYSDTITQIKTLRDNLYAHTDRKKLSLEELNVDRIELEKIFDFVEDVIQSVYQICLDGHALTTLSTNIIAKANVRPFGLASSAHYVSIVRAAISVGQPESGVFCQHTSHAINC